MPNRIKHAIAFVIGFVAGITAPAIMGATLTGANVSPTECSQYKLADLATELKVLGQQPRINGYTSTQWLHHYAKAHDIISYDPQRRVRIACLVSLLH